MIENDETLENGFKNGKRKKFERILLGNNEYLPNSNFSAPTLILNRNTGRYYIRNILKQQELECNGKLRGAKRVSAAYDLFKKTITDNMNDTILSGVYSNKTDYYNKLTDAVTDKIQFVEIECSESSNAFQVFDSLNGKGFDLTAADRIKSISYYKILY